MSHKNVDSKRKEISHLSVVCYCYVAKGVWGVHRMLNGFNQMVKEEILINYNDNIKGSQFVIRQAYEQ